MATIPHQFVSVTTAQTTTSSSYVDVPGASISNFTAGKKYLIYVTAQFCNSTGTSWVALQLLHGSTIFNQSVEMINFLVTNEYKSYGFFTVWTAVSSEDIKLQFRLGTGTAKVDQVAMFSMRLSDHMVENTDWFYNENDTDSSLTTTDLTGGTLTWTPAVNNEHWLVMTLAQYNFTSTSIGSQSQINWLGASPAYIPYSTVFQFTSGADFRFSVNLARVYTLPNSSQTLAEKSASSGGNANTRLFSAIFALNLSKFNNHANPAWAAVGLGATPFVTQLNTASITPTVTGDVWIGGYWSFNCENTGREGQSRLQVDNTDSVATQTSDAYWFSNHGYVSRPPINHQSVLSMSNAAHTIDMDGSSDSTSGGPFADGATVWAVTMEYPGAGPPSFNPAWARGSNQIIQPGVS